MTNKGKTDMDSDELDLLKVKKEIWEKAVDTQMHFNEMSVKSRQLGLTFVVAALGVAAVLISRGQGYGIAIPGWGHLHVASIIVLIAAGGIYAVRTLDLKVYHRMLRGAVTFGEKLEQELREAGLFNVPKGMAECISEHSRYETIDADTLKGSGGKLLAYNKISRFYNVAITALLVISFLTALAFRNVESDTTKMPTTASVNAEEVAPLSSIRIQQGSNEAPAADPTKKNITPATNSLKSTGNGQAAE